MEGARLDDPLPTIDKLFRKVRTSDSHAINIPSQGERFHFHWLPGAMRQGGPTRVPQDAAPAGKRLECSKRPAVPMRDNKGRGSEMDSTLPPFREEAEEILHTLDKISARGEIPALRWTVKQLAGLSPEDELSAQELAETILEDLGLTSKVLRAVNSSFYNRSEHEISTVTQAVILLGFDTIRDIAIEMAMLSLLSKGSQGAAVELLAGNLVTARMVKQISRQRLKGAEVEQAFLAALFHQVARVVLAIHSPGFYNMLKEREEKGTKIERKRAERLLRFAGEELSKRWNIPKAISKHLEGQRPPKEPAALMLNGIIKEAAVLVDLTISAAPGREIQDRLRHMGKELEMPPSLLAESLREAVYKTQCLAPSLKQALAGARPPGRDGCGGTANETALQKGPQPALDQGKDPAGPPPGRAEEAETVLDLLDQGAHAQAGSGLLDDTYLELLYQVGETACARNRSLNQLFIQVVEALHVGLGLERSFLCLFTPDRTKLIVRHGLGRNAKAFREHFRLSHPVKDCPVTRAFEERGEVISTWGKILRGSSALVDEASPAQVCISPVVVSGKPIGCFLLDRSVKGSGFSDADKKKIAALRHIIVLATMERGAR